MGRAVLMLESGFPADREIILDACRHRYTYDRQLDNNRSLQLFDVLHATGEPDWYADQLRDDFRQIANDDDGDQLFDLGVLLLRSGRTDLRPILYESLGRLIANGEIPFASALIGLEGESAYRFVVQQSASLPSTEDPWQEHGLLQDLIDKIGEEATRRFTQKLAAENGKQAAYLARVWAEHERVVAYRNSWRKGPPPPLPDYETISRWIGSTDKRPPFSPIRGGRKRKVDVAVLRQLAEDFVAESDPARQERYLRLFYNQVFPLDVAPLLSIAWSNDERLSYRAVHALRNVSHASVRALGLEFLEAPDHAFHAPELLVLNPGEGDSLRFEALIEHTDDEYDLHRTGMGVGDYVEANPSADAVNSLVLLYLKGPCGFCRRDRFVETLIKMNALPDWMRRECAYDSERETRRLVL